MIVSDPMTEERYLDEVKRLVATLPAGQQRVLQRELDGDEPPAFHLDPPQREEYDRPPYYVLALSTYAQRKIDERGKALSKVQHRLTPHSATTPRGPTGPARAAARAETPTPAERPMPETKIPIEPGARHPAFPNWQVERVVHSPGHPELVKHQWVRRDGVRGDLMGWNARPGQTLTHSKHWTPAGTEFTMDLKDKQQLLGPDDATLRTVRYQSGLVGDPEHPDGVAMTWPPREGVPEGFVYIGTWEAYQDVYRVEDPSALADNNLDWRVVAASAGEGGFALVVREGSFVSPERAGLRHYPELVDRPGVDPESPLGRLLSDHGIDPSRVIVIPLPDGHSKLPSPYKQQP